MLLVASLQAQNCNICGDGNSLQNPQGVVEFVYQGTKVKNYCERWQQVVKNVNVISDEFCRTEMLQYTMDVCLCTTPEGALLSDLTSPTIAPTPSSAFVLDPTPAPSLPNEIPVDIQSTLATLGPSSMPSSPPTQFPSSLPTSGPSSLPTAIPSILPISIPTSGAPIIDGINKTDANAVIEVNPVPCTGRDRGCSFINSANSTADGATLTDGINKTDTDIEIKENPVPCGCDTGCSFINSALDPPATIDGINETVANVVSKCEQTGGGTSDCKDSVVKDTSSANNKVSFRFIVVFALLSSFFVLR